MSTRRSLSFAEDELDLASDYDTNGGSKYAKECMKFFKKFKDRIFLVPDSLNVKPVTNNNQKTNIRKLIK